MNLDLHTHSSFSDGVLSPAELVVLASKSSVSLLAIADHDSVSGVDEAIAAGRVYGVNLIPAVELSVEYDGWDDVHILGYGINHHDPAFLNNLADFRVRRESRSEVILDRVNEKLSSEGKKSLSRLELQAISRGSVGRPHIARLLIEYGYAGSVEGAFNSYLIPCNVPKIYWPVSAAIDEIQRIGGLAVLAHPTSITKDLAELGTIVGGLALLGIDGIEVFNNMAWPNEMEFIRRLAVEKKLFSTAGSDFHGMGAGVEIGRGRGGVSFNSSMISLPVERMVCS